MRSPASGSGLMFRNPALAVFLIIVIGGLLRLVFGASLGLGIDESYMVASGRVLHLGYFDHPPASWWLTWSASRLFGSEAPLAVRLPFIVLFALSTWLIYRLTAALYDAAAGVAAALILNLVPVLGVTSGTWVLPDGPLCAALLGAALCLVHALEARRPASYGWWLMTGLLSGLALFSKYTAGAVIAGAVIYLATSSRHRRWLLRPEPYLAALVALAIFSPVLVWNAGNGWASLAFQGGRAAAARLNLLGPVRTLAGEALYVLPWIWLPLVIVAARATLRGPSEWRGWLLVCLGLPLVVVFPVIALWSNRQILFHWAAPGYLMLIPLLAEAVARRLVAGNRLTRLWLRGTVVFVVAVVIAFSILVRFNPLPSLWAKDGPLRQLAYDGTDWTGLPAALGGIGLPPGPDMLAAGVNWRDCGKIDYGLGGRTPFICLSQDARQFGFRGPGPADYLGRDVVIVLRAGDLGRLAVLARNFKSLEDRGTIRFPVNGATEIDLHVFIGHDLLAWP